MRIYLVQPGDTLDQLANRFQVTEERILEANPHIEDPGYLPKGMKVRIPRGKIALSVKKREPTESEKPKVAKSDVVEVLPTYVLPLDLELADWDEESRESVTDQVEYMDEFDWDSYDSDYTSSSLEPFSSYPFLPYFPTNPTYSAETLHASQWYFPYGEQLQSPCSCTQGFPVAHFPQVPFAQPPIAYHSLSTPTVSMEAGKIDSSAEF